MKRQPIFIASLASALLIGLPITGHGQTTGGGSTGGGTTQGTGTGTTGTGTTRGTTNTRNTTGTQGTYNTRGTTGLDTQMPTGSGVSTRTGSPRLGDPYSGPAIEFSTTPDILVVPGTEVSYIQNSNYDMYRMGTNWYYRYNGHWYRGTNYKGPYTYVSTSTVPRSIRNVPAKYRHNWGTTTSSTTRVSGTRNASTSKARVQSRRNARTARYTKSTRNRSTRSKARTSSMIRGSEASYDDSRESGVGGSGSSQATTPEGSSTPGSAMYGSPVVGSPYSGPAITFQTQPTIAIIPGTQISYLRNSDYDMYRYGNSWYMNQGGTWYRGGNYSGPYIVIDATTVPQQVTTVPAQYRRHWR